MTRAGAIGMRARRWLACILAVSLFAGCAPAVRPTTQPPAAADLGEFWRAPANPADQDLASGAGGAALAPDPSAAYRFVKKDTAGYSDGYDVTGPDGLEWSVKLGAEAQPEVVASRLLWAAGYHQPPTYYLPEWRLVDGPDAGVKGQARFRPKVPWLHKAGEWAWHRNPFVTTQAFRGLIVLNLMLNNADLRTPNNILYDVSGTSGGARRWYVVRDLGASFGATGFVYGTRNDLDGFERQRFVTRTSGTKVEFDYHGRHRELLRVLSTADVRWAAERWAALTETQWRAAFAAANYPPDVAVRYIAKLRAKIAEGLALPAPVPR